jgi:hypothetical protein
MAVLYANLIILLYTINNSIMLGVEYSNGKLI